MMLSLAFFIFFRLYTMALNRDHRYKFSSDKVISGLGPNTTMVNENLQPLTKLASDTEVDTDTELDSITMASPIVPQSAPHQSELPPTSHTRLTTPPWSLSLSRPCPRPRSPPVSRRAQVRQKARGRKHIARGNPPRSRPQQAQLSQRGQQLLKLTEHAQPRSGPQLRSPHGHNSAPIGHTSANPHSNEEGDVGGSDSIPNGKSIANNNDITNANYKAQIDGAANEHRTTNLPGMAFSGCSGTFNFHVININTQS